MNVLAGMAIPTMFNEYMLKMLKIFIVGGVKIRTTNLSSTDRNAEIVKSDAMTGVRILVNGLSLVYVQKTKMKYEINVWNPLI
jgi:hypothetical protein